MSPSNLPLSTKLKARIFSFLYGDNDYGWDVKWIYVPYEIMEKCWPWNDQLWWGRHGRDLHTRTRSDLSTTKAQTSYLLSCLQDVEWLCGRSACTRYSIYQSKRLLWQCWRYTSMETHCVEKVRWKNFVVNWIHNQDLKSRIKYKTYRYIHANKWHLDFQPGA